MMKHNFIMAAFLAAFCTLYAGEKAAPVYSLEQAVLPNANMVFVKKPHSQKWLLEMFPETLRPYMENLEVVFSCNVERLDCDDPSPIQVDFLFAATCAGKSMKAYMKEMIAELNAKAPEDRKPIVTEAKVAGLEGWEITDGEYRDLHVVVVVTPDEKYLFGGPKEMIAARAGKTPVEKDAVNVFGGILPEAKDVMAVFPFQAMMDDLVDVMHHDPDAEKMIRGISAFRAFIAENAEMMKLQCDMEFKEAELARKFSKEYLDAMKGGFSLICAMALENPLLKFPNTLQSYCKDAHCGVTLAFTPGDVAAIARFIEGKVKKRNARAERKPEKSSQTDEDGAVRIEIKK